MSDENKKCTVCGQKLEDGFLLEFAVGTAFPVRWVKGAPEKTFSGVLSWTDRENFGVRAFKCVVCGHVELYADAKPWPTSPLG